MNDIFHHQPALEKALAGAPPIIGVPGSAPLLNQGLNVHSITSKLINHAVGLEYVSYAFQIESDPRKEIKTCSIPFRPEQDVIDLLPFSRNKDGGISIYLLEKPRPVLTQRDALGLEAISPTGMQVNLPGFYYGEDGSAASINSACQKYLETYGLASQTTVVNLGAGYFVNAMSPELVLPRCIQVEESEWEKKTLYGQAFSCQVSVLKFTPQQIIDGFYDGTITDLRLVQTVLRFCQKENIPLRPSVTPFTLSRQFTAQQIRIPILTKEEIQNKLESLQNSLLNIQKCETPHLHQDQILYRAQASVQRDDSLFDEKFEFDVVTSKNPDSIHGMPIFLVDGKIHVLINIAERVTATLRNEVAHQVYSNHGPQRLEGIYTRVNGTVSPGDYQTEFSRVLKATWGVESIASSDRRGVGTLSPGYDPEVGSFFLTEIDPTVPVSGIYKEQTFALSLEDLDDCVASGVIHSLELIVTCELLKQEFPGSIDARKHPSLYDDAIRNELSEIINGVSRTRTILAQQHRGVFAALMSHHEGQRFIAFLQNESLGITHARSSASVEVGAFDGTSGLSPLESEENDSEHGLLSFHDALHAILRDPVLRGMTFDEYRTALLSRECDALWFSEVHLPRIYGYERYAQQLGKTSLGEVFDYAGINSSDEQRQAIRLMVMKGELPEKLARSDRYHEIQWCVREKLLGYYVRDFKTNCRILYEDKAQHPIRNRVLAMFVLANPPTLEDVLAYPHAVNNLKEYATSLRSAPETLKSISQLASIVESHFDSQSKSDRHVYNEAWVLIIKLSDAFEKLSSLSQKINSAEVDEENLAIFSEIRALASDDGPFAEAHKFCVQHYSGEREFPSTTIHPFFTTPEQAAEVQTIEAAELARINSSHRQHDPMPTPIEN